jgi:glycerol kinase
MPERLTLVIDQGTHATRAILFDKRGQERFVAMRPVALHRLDSDHIEQDGAEIIASMQAVLNEALGSDVARAGKIEAAGLATQRSTIALWDRESGRTFGPLLSWQDRRAADSLIPLADREPEVRERTGLPLSPHYGASKLRWSLDHFPGARDALAEKRLAYGPLAAFLLWHLLDGSPELVDDANANRTQLWNITTRDWDPWLLALFDLPADPLPACRPIRYPYGLIADTDIPLAVVNGDQNAAVYGQGAPQPGTAIVNLGTGAFVLAPTGRELIRHPALLSGITNGDETGADYTIEGTVNGAGAAVAWAGQQLGIPHPAQKLNGWLQESPNPGLFLNSIGGLGSPWWQPGPDAAWTDPDEDTAGHIAAVAESILFLIQANLDAMRAAGLDLRRIQISGGLANADNLCQRLADLSGLPVYRPQQREATARGTAWLAMGQPSDWGDGESGDRFEPGRAPGLHERYHRFIDLIASA